MQESFRVGKMRRKREMKAEGKKKSAMDEVLKGL